MDWKQTTAYALTALMTAACGTTAPTRQEEARRIADKLPDVTVTDKNGCTYVPNPDKTRQICQIDDYPLRPK